MTLLVQPLFDGPLDIVGDVHGEIEALHALVNHLGYDRDGVHALGRRLVFVGDLTDRGPDSPAVVRFVQRLIVSGRAQSVLGNHDLNILLGWRKYDNPWFFGQEFCTSSGHRLPQQLADEAIRASTLDFFRSLPLALERPGLRVVHAYWDSPMIELARAASSAEALHEEHRLRIDGKHQRRAENDAVTRELEHQNLNPVKLLTSGPEEPASKPKHSGGSLRRTQRSTWWLNRNPSESEPEKVCIFGHYALPRGAERASRDAYCIDYGVGKRALERLAGRHVFESRLAAFRWPERQIVFDDGDSETWLRAGE